MKLNSIQKRLHSYTQESWPEAKAVDPEVFKQIHANLRTSPIDACEFAFKALSRDDLEFVCYILPPGEGGASIDNCCNGIRYSTEGGYISLPRIPAKFFKDPENEQR